MDFEWLQDELSKILNFNTGQTNQDWTAQQLKDALNSAYRREVRIAKLEGNRDFFREVTEITWPSGEQTLTLPSSIQRKEMLRVEDITDSDSPGQRMLFGHYGQDGHVFWKSRNTLQWGVPDGPGSDRTLRVFYFADIAEMVDDIDEPDLVPPENRELLVWSAACWLRRVADERAPREWQQMLKDEQLDYIKATSRARPVGEDVAVRARHTDYGDVFF